MTEIIGWDDDEIGADELDELMSEVSGSRRGRNTRLAKKLPLTLVGIPRTAVAAGGSAVIQVPVQLVMRPDRLVVDRAVAANFDLQSLRVGTIELNASNNPIPCDMFAPDSTAGELRAVATATPSVGIQVTVNNTDGANPHTFGGAFRGPTTNQQS